MSTVANKIVQTVERNPGSTETEIARVIFGGNGYQQKVNQHCRLLIANGIVVRKRMGGPADPFRYFLMTQTRKAF